MKLAFQIPARFLSPGLLQEGVLVMFVTYCLQPESGIVDFESIVFYRRKGYVPCYVTGCYL